MRPPVFQQPLHDITAPEGKSVHFEVRFTGSPAPDVAWFRGPKRILPSATYKVIHFFLKQDDLLEDNDCI